MESRRLHDRNPERSRDGMGVHQEFSNDPIYLTISALRNFRIAAADAMGLRATRLPTGLIDAGGLPDEIHLLRRDLTCEPEVDPKSGDIDPYFNSTYFPVKKFDEEKTRKVIKFIRGNSSDWKTFCEYARKLSNLSSIQIASDRISKIAESTAIEDYTEEFGISRTVDGRFDWEEASKLLHHWLVSLFSRLPIRGQITKPLFNRMKRKLLDEGKAGGKSRCGCLGFLVYVKESTGSEMPRFHVFDLFPPGCHISSDLKAQPADDPQPPPQVKNYDDSKGRDLSTDKVESLYIDYLIHLFYNDKDFDGENKKEILAQEASWFLFLPLYDSWNPEFGFEGTFRGWLFGNYPSKSAKDGEPDKSGVGKTADPVGSKRRSMVTNLMYELLVPESEDADDHAKRLLFETKEDVLKSISSQAALLLLASERLSDSLRRAEQDAVLKSESDDKSPIRELLEKNLHQLEGWKRFAGEAESEEGNWRFYEDFPSDDRKTEISYLAVNLDRQWPETGEGEIIRIYPDDAPLTIIPRRNLVSSEIFFDTLAARLRRLHGEFTNARARQQLGRTVAGQEHHAAMAHEMRKIIHRISKQTPKWALDALRSYFYSLTVSKRDFLKKNADADPWLQWESLNENWPEKLCSGRNLAEWCTNHAEIAIEIQNLADVVGDEEISDACPPVYPLQYFDMCFDSSEFLIVDGFRRDSGANKNLQRSLGFACALVCALRNVLQNMKRGTKAKVSVAEAVGSKCFQLVIVNEARRGRGGAAANRELGGTYTAMMYYINLYGDDDSEGSGQTTKEIQFEPEPEKGYFRTAIPIPIGLIRKSGSCAQWSL